MFCSMSTATQYFPILIHKCKVWFSTARGLCSLCGTVAVVHVALSIFWEMADQCRYKPGECCTSIFYSSCVVLWFINVFVEYIITEITKFIMRVIHYIYRYTPTYRVTLPSYPTHEAKVQIGMA